MSIILRPYQRDFVRNLSASIVRNKRIVACAPTGSGKTKIFITIADTATSRGRAVVIISESTKIFKQINEDADGILINAGIKHRKIIPGKLYIAMAQTLARRPLIIEQLNQLDPAPLVIVDEAHIGTPTKILQKLRPEIMVLGFTATPDARVAKHLPDLYNDCVVACQVDDLIQQGFLCSYMHKGRTKAKIDLLQIKGGEYTETSQNQAFNTQAVYDGLLEDLKKETFSKCMIFVASIAHCEDLYHKMVADGYKVTRYHSKLDNAEYELAKFTQLDIADICISVASLTKGFDYPPIDLVILNRKTTSLPLYLQMLGRGSRVISGVKKHFLVLDYGENWLQHGYYFQDRPWDKLWKQTKKGKKGEGVAPLALCPSCEAIIPANIKICPYCKNERPKTEKELEQGELVEVTQHYTRLVGRKVSSLTPSELSIYAKIKNKQRFAARIAKAQEQRSPGYLGRFAKMMGYKEGWVILQKKQAMGNKIDFADIILR